MDLPFINFVHVPLEPSPLAPPASASLKTNNSTGGPASAAQIPSSSMESVFRALIPVCSVIRGDSALAALRAIS